MKKFLHLLFLSCLKATELLEKKLYFPLSIREKMQLSMHKSMCKACTLYDNQSIMIDNILKNYQFKHEDIDIEKVKTTIKQNL